MLKHALTYIFFGLMFISHAQKHNSFSYIDLNVYTALNSFTFRSIKKQRMLAPSNAVEYGIKEYGILFQGLDNLF